MAMLPEEDFGTFDLVLIDLVVDIFDLLRVGDHNERLIDYMMKFVQPNGLLVRQEDYWEKNVVDFAKYTVDLNVFGMPHTCSQYFTMGSNGIDFSNHDRVDHELDDLVWYEPNVDSNDHTLMWGNYRNNGNPPDRICLQDTDDENVTKGFHHDVITEEFFTERKLQKKGNTGLVPSVGIFVAVEIENVTMALETNHLLQESVKTALDRIGFGEIDLKVTSRSSVYDSFVFVFDEGYLSMRTWFEHNYCSIDLQLWNSILKKDRTVSQVVKAIGGNIEDDSVSSFSVTTGGMFGIHNSPRQNGSGKYNNQISPSYWCQHEAVHTDERKNENLEQSELLPKQQEELGIVINEMLSNFIARTDPTLLILCPPESSPCSTLNNVDFGESQVIPLFACPDIMNGDTSSLNKCKKGIVKKIRDTISLSKGKNKKIEAIIIDSEAPIELGQITNKIFYTDTPSHQWLSHDFVLFAPSPHSTSNSIKNNVTFDSTSWRYQYLERFRTDIVEFDPVYHATVSFDAIASSKSTWNLGMLSAGNARFYDQLIKTLDLIRDKLDFNTISLLESKSGVISHIPDYQPSKWATPSDYDIQPAATQWSEQRPLGGQIIVQYDRVSPSLDDISVGAEILFQRKGRKHWCQVRTRIRNLISRKLVFF